MLARSTTTILITVLLAAYKTANSYSLSASTFTGRNVFAVNHAVRRQQSSARGDITMKKGKSNVPPNMRAQYSRQQEMAKMRDEMEAAQRPGADGLPVFNLFVRTKRANMWYPCGSFKGDDRTMALASSYRDEGMLAGISKNQLDSGVAGSLSKDLEKLKETIIRAYPQLRKSRKDLEFGYKLAFDGLKENQTGINKIEPKENKGFMDNIMGMFGN